MMKDYFDFHFDCVKILVERRRECIGFFKLDFSSRSAEVDLYEISMNENNQGWTVVREP